MGEEGVREAHKGGVSLAGVHVTLLKLPAPRDPEVFVRECVPSRQRAIIAGLPGRLERFLAECALKTAYAYTVEDSALGARVRNRNLLYLMNLLGHRQVRDVVDAIDSVLYVVVVGESREEVEEAARAIEAGCGATRLEPRECDPEVLATMASSRIKRYSG